jgi:CubicO group peptidase (beta-lactamase class C family)
MTSIYGRARAALACTLLSLTGLSAAEVDDGLLEARVASFENGIGAAVTFRTFEALFHTERVPRSTQPWALPYDLKDLSSFRYEYEGTTKGLAEFLEGNRTNALLVLKDGKIVQEIYRNGATEDSHFISFSVGKSITSSLLGIALEEGKLDSLDEPVTAYVPKLIGSGYDGPTVRDLMQMSSGVDLKEIYDLKAEGRNLFAEGIYNTWFSEAMHFSDFAATLEHGTAPGTAFNYNTFDTQVLGKVLEGATRERFTDYAHTALWEPLGMESDLLMVMDSDHKDREAMAGGGYLITLRDYGRFGQMILNRGEGNGQRLLSEAWIDEATQADPSKPFLQVNAIIDEGVLNGYQHQWWLFPDGDFSAEGVFGQYVFIMPRYNVVIVKLSYWEGAWVADKAHESLAFFQALGAYLSGD